MILYSPTVTGSLLVTGSIQVTGSLDAPTITGSLFGTASWAQNAITSSYILNAISASFSLTASSADNFLVRGTLTAQTIVAQVITSSTDFVTGSTRFGTLISNTHQFTGSVSITGSLNVVGAGITGSLFGTASWANNATSASFAQNATTASYVLNAVSSSFAATASSADNFLIRQNATASNLLVNNTITAQTLVVQTVTSSIVFSSGSNIFGNQLTNVQQFTGSLRVTGSGNHYIMGGSFGVGTISPSEKLHTIGNIKIEQTSNTNAVLTLNPSSGVLGTGYQWNLVGVNSGGNYAFQIREASSSYLTITNSAGGIGGNTGIGTISPAYKLDVAGDANITANLTATGSIKFPSLSNSNQTNVVGYNTATGQLFYQTTSSLSVASASYAATSSYATNFTIQDTLNFAGTLTDYASVASSIVGSNNLFTQATASYTSAFFKYTVATGSNARTGEMLAVWNGTSVQFTDNSTLDIGSTTPVTCSVSVVSGDVQFNVQTNTSGWRIKSIGTFM